MSRAKRSNGLACNGLYQKTERLVQEIGRIYALADELPVKSRFYLLAALFKWQGSTAVALENSAKKELAMHLCPEVCDAAFGIGSKLSEILSLATPSFDLTYTAIGYWSPIGREDLRHSVFHRVLPTKDHERRLILAYAYCFYALTFAGISRREKPLISVTQYNATKAPDCPGLTAEYLLTDKPPEDENAWPIKQKLGEELLSFLGLSSWAEEISGYEERILEISLRGLLERTPVLERVENHLDAPAQEEVEKRLQNSAHDVLDTFCSKALNLPPELKNEISNSCSRLCEAFRNGRYAGEIPINHEMACFMHATHMMWQKTCPTKFTYTFTVPILDPLGTDTTCTLTVGTSAQISEETRLMISRIVWALFMNPLILDYASIERERMTAEAFRGSSRLLGHNLPNLAIAPCITQLLHVKREVQQTINEERGKRLSHEIRELLENVLHRAEIGIPTLEHYETLLAYVLGSTSIADIFRPNVDRSFSFGDEAGKDDGLVPFPLSDVFEPLRSVVEMHKERYACGEANRKKLAQAFSIDLHEAEPLYSTQIIEQRTLLREALFNMVQNSLSTIDNTALKEKRGQVRVAARIENEVLIIDIMDRGAGFGDELIVLKSEIARVMATDGEEQFETVVSELTGQKAISTRKGNFGLGLVFCAAYARSREWSRQGCRSGELIIASTSGGQYGEGASVRLVVPVVVVNALAFEDDRERKNGNTHE